MPKNLTGDTASFPTQTAPIDGEARVAGSVETPFQNAADRTAYLKDRLDFLDPYKLGARIVRYATTIEAAKTITSANYGDGQVCFIRRYGFYHYESTASDAVDEPWIFRPDDNPAGNGRWVHENYAQRSSYSDETVSGTTVFDSTTFVDRSTLTLASLSVGDIVRLSFLGYAYVSDVGGPDNQSVKYRMRVTQPITAEATLGDSVATNGFISSFQYEPLVLERRHTVSEAGSHTFKVQVGNDSGTREHTVEKSFFCAHVIRNT